MKFSLRMLFCVISIVCVLCAVGVRYYATRRPLTVWLRESNDTYVDGGKVFLNGQFMGETPLTIHESDITRLGYKIVKGKSDDWRYGRNLSSLGVLLDNVVGKDGKSPLLWIDAEGEEPGKYETARSEWGRCFVDGFFLGGLKDAFIRRSPLDANFPLYQVQIDSAKRVPDSDTVEVRFSCRMDLGTNIHFIAKVRDISSMSAGATLEFDSLRIVDSSDPSVHQFAGQLPVSRVRPYSYVCVLADSATPMSNPTHSFSPIHFIDGMK